MKLVLLIIILLTYVTDCTCQKAETVLWGTYVDPLLQTPRENLFDFTGYTIGWKQGIAWTAFGIAGAIHGALEAYHADPRCFEKTWNSKEKSFYGPRAWERNYGNNDYSTGNHKGEWFGNVGRDFWHTGRFTEKCLLIGGSFTIGMGKRKIKYKVVDLIAGAAISTVTANITYKALRK